MIIEIDGYFNSVLLQSDENFSLNEIEGIYLDLKAKIKVIDEIPNRFCKEYNMIEIDKAIKNKADIVIDTDTDRIYKPVY
ncbi:hypothetical protein [Paenibacillus polymyxa]|uniref:hypothetical protein n=1 Tax=Paenibacillus polymyxa TaxID=1406 RepID=UPI0032AF69B1